MNDVWWDSCLVKVFVTFASLFEQSSHCFVFVSLESFEMNKFVDFEPKNGFADFDVRVFLFSNIFR